MKQVNAIQSHIVRYKGAIIGAAEDGFVFQIPHKHALLRVICSYGNEWEHVSVSLPRKQIPSWEQMCYIKDLIWHDTETVMQLHPAKANYINQHPGCLHMWKPTGAAIPLPPLWMV